jgi:type II secretory pathway pseudopilin PulG
MKSLLSQKSNFALTITELLAALAVLAIAFTLLIPAFTKSRCGPSKAESVVWNIVNSVRSFQTDYDTLPLVAVPRNEKEQFIFVGDPKSGALHSNAGLFDVLRAIPRGVNANHALNPRRQMYFEEAKATDPKNPRDGFADGKEFAEQIQGRLYDPHGSEYCVVLNTGNEEVLNLSGIYTDLKDPIRYRVVSFSLGKDRQLGTAGDRMLCTPRGNAPREDTVSWR